MDSKRIKKETQETEQANIYNKAKYCYACGSSFQASDFYCAKCGQPRRKDDAILRLSKSLIKSDSFEDGNMVEDNSPISVMENQGYKKAIEAMTKEYYLDKKQRISLDACQILINIYHPYIASFRDIKANSEDGKLVRYMGIKLDELDGWIGMIKTYNDFRKTNPAHQLNLAELWSGIGEWTL